MNITFDFKEFKEFLAEIEEEEVGRCGRHMTINYDLEGNLVIRNLMENMYSDKAIHKEVSLRGVVQE